MLSLVLAMHSYGRNQLRLTANRLAKKAVSWCVTDTGCLFNCYLDPEADPVLIELNTRPTVLLRPQFTSDVFIYQTTVSFDTMVLQLWGKASTCQSDVRINTRHEEDTQ